MTHDDQRETVAEAPSMSCGECGHQNAATAKFCAECGARQQRRCPGCGADARAGAKFCDQCGTGLDGVTAPATGPTAVRKQVTALFADLVGSTAFGERVDPEAARAALAPYFDILQTTIEAHAGTVSKFTGDGVFAVFGIPEVAEDDALRAVAAGRELQRRFGAFAEQVRDRHGVELGLRVGINSGELVVGDDDADLVGDVLNTAARLEGACTPGRVMVGEDTWRLTRSTIGYEVLGEISVKGKVAPIATFQVVETDDAPIEETIPFVGRADELGELLAAFEHASASPTLQLVTIVGAPGVGKTRLASELRAAVSARSFDLRFERRGSTTFSPIADLLRAVGDGSAESIDRLLVDHPEADRLAPVLQSFLGHGAARSTEESFWAVRRLLEHLADQQGPQVIVVDDIQWAEPLFWDLLEHLVEWTAAPVLVIALARPELRELRPELATSGGRVAASIALDGLDDGETSELAARLLDTDELPRELTDRLPGSTQGNPLFVRELVNMLVDDGTLEQSGDRWTLTIDADAIDVPPTILSLLASRVERLPADERAVIELASVIGTEFDRGTLTAMSGDEATGPLVALLDRLRRRDLVEPSGTWAGDHPVYRFHHVLVRDAAYRRLLKERRAVLHELVGRHIESVDGVGAESDVVIAHHFEQVVTYRRELGLSDDATDALAAQAVVRLRRAADAALEREDLPAAGAYAQRSIALVDDGSDERDELLLLGCEALLSSGAVAAAGPLVTELSDRSTDERLAAWADCFRAQLWSLTDPDRLDEAAERSDAAARELDRLGDPAGVAKARLVRASCLARLGRVGECESELDLALGAARQAGDRRRTVAVLGTAPLAALWGPSPVSRAGGRCLDVLRLLRITTASPAVEATSIRCQGVLEALRGRMDSARDKLQQSRAAAQELGLQQGLFETELFAGWVELWAGDAAAAEPHLRAAHDGLGRLGIGADAGQAGALLARSLLMQGRVDEAESLAVDAVAAAGQNLQTAIASRSVLAEVRAGQDRIDEAETLIVEALETAERTDIVLDHALALEAAARVSGATSHRSQASRLLSDKGVTDERTTVSDSSPTVDPKAPTNRASAVIDRMLDAATRGDRAAFEAAGAPGLVGRRHEPMRTFETHTIEQQADAVFERGSTAFVDSMNSAVVTTRGDRLALVRLDQPSDGFDMTLFIVAGCDEQDRLDTWETFGGDQLAAALDELDRRSAQRATDDAAAGAALADPLRNDAAGIFDRFMDAFERWDTDAMRALVTDDFHHSIRVTDAAVQTDVPFDEMLHQWELSHGWEPDLIRALKAVRGDDLALVDFTMDVDGFATRRLIVVATAGGVLSRLIWFDPDQLADATAELDRRLAERDAAIPPQTELRNLATITFLERLGEGGDGERTSTEWFRDDMVYEVHRRGVGGAGGGRSDYFDTARSWGEVGLMSTSEATAVRGDRLAIITVTLSSDGADEIVVHGIVEVDERGVIAYIGVWDDSDRTLAEAELDRRWQAQQAESIAGWEVIERAARAWLDDDEAGWRACYADDFRGAGREQLSSHRDDVGLDEWAAASFDLRRQATDVDISTERVAQRGDHWFVSRATGGMDGNDLGWIFVSQVVDGRIRRELIFDPDHQDEAIAEADRGFLADLDIGDDHPSAHLWPAMYTTDPAVFAPRLHDDYVIHDRRGIGWPDLTRDQFLAAMQEIPAELHVDVPAVHRVSDAGVVFERSEFTPGEATRLDWITVASHEDGLIRDCTLFAIDQLDAALAEWEQIERRHAASADSPPRSTDVASTPDDDSGHEVPPLSNAEVELSARVAEAWSAGRLGDISRWVEPDFRVVSRRASLPHVEAGSESLEQSTAFWGERPAALETMAIAIRGDHLSVMENRVVTPDGNETSGLTVGQLGPSGRWQLIAHYDRPQLDEALDELDRLWVDHGGRADVAEIGRRWRDALIAPTFDPSALPITDDFVTVDHRPLGLGRRGVDEYVASMADITPIATAYSPRIFGQVDDWVFNEVHVQLDEGGSAWQSLQVTRIVGAAMAENHVFDLDQYDEASAWFERITSRAALPELTNAADRLSKRLTAARTHQDRDAGSALLHPDFEFVVRRPGWQDMDPQPADRSSYLDFLSDITDRLGGVPELRDRRVVALRGEQLALSQAVDTVNGNELPSVTLTECLDGHIRHVATWDPAQLIEALDELDRRWADRGGDAGLVDRFIRSRTAFATPGLDTGALPFADDFVTIDHRPMGLGRRGLTEFIDSAGHITPTTFVVPQILDHVGDLSLYEVQFVRNDDDFLWHAIHIARAGEDDLVHENHVFDIDQLEEARMTFDRLVAEGAYSEQASERVLNATPNATWRIAMRFGAFIRPGDRARMDAMTHPDYVITNHGRLESVTPEVEAGDSAEHHIETFTELGFTTRTELVAVRGDDLCLIRYDFHPDDWHVPRLLLVRCEDGMVRRADWYDIEQLDEAYDQLNEWWAALGGPADIPEFDRRFRGAFRDGPVDALRSLTADDFVSIDHRPLGFGTRSRDAWVESLAPIVGRASVITHDHIDRRGPAELVRASIRLDGSVIVDGYVVSVRRDGLMTHNELFELSQLDEARARLGALADADDDVHPGELINREVEHSRRLAAVWPNEAFDEFYEPDAIWIARRASAPATEGGREFVDRMREYWQSVGAEMTDSEVVAIRDEVLSLARQGIRTTDGDEFVTLLVGELGPSGRWGRIVAFDDGQLDEALDELDRRWVERGGPARLAEVMCDFRRLAHEGDRSDVESFVASDLVSIDHRSLGMGERGHDAWVESMLPLAGRTEFTMHRVLAHDDRVGLIQGTVSQAEEGSWHLLYLLRVDDGGRVDRYEIFDWSDIATARRRFDEVARHS